MKQHVCLLDTGQENQRNWSGQNMKIWLESAKAAMTKCHGSSNRHSFLRVLEVGSSRSRQSDSSLGEDHSSSFQTFTSSFTCVW